MTDTDTTTPTDTAEWTVVRMPEDMDPSSAVAIRQEFYDLHLEGHHHLVVDMSKVEFIDSTGLGVLVGQIKRATAHGGQLRIAALSKRALMAFRITGMTKVFAVYDSVQEAMTP